jgi:hypothetical protein
MIASKRVLILAAIILMANSFCILSYGQDNNWYDKEKLANIIDSPRFKQILAHKDANFSGISFDMDSLAFDPFRKDVVVSTVDFEHINSGLQGTVSFAHRWKSGGYELLGYAYWAWGTVVSGNISTDTTWTLTESPYYVTDWIEVEEGVTLTIEPGTVVRFRKSNEYLYGLEVAGALFCQGATFTTSCDIEYYDLSQVSENNCDWLGIWVYENGICVIEDSLIEYAVNGIHSEGGSNLLGNTIKRCNYGMDLYEEIGSFVVQSNLIEDCETGMFCVGFNIGSGITENTITMGTKWWGSVGLYCLNSSPLIYWNSISGYSDGAHCSNSSPDMKYNNLLSNFYGINTRNGSSPLIANNNFEDNSYGVHNSDDAVLIMAEANWWGDATGPYHPSDNPGGLGDQVSDYVDFDPWLTNPYTVSLMALLN